MSVATPLVLAATGLSVTMVVAWYVALRTDRSGWIDAIWSFAVGIFGAWAALLVSAADSSVYRQWLVAILALAWSLRLAHHIANRTARSGQDDPR